MLSLKNDVILTKTVDDADATLAGFALGLALASDQIGTRVGEIRLVFGLVRVGRVRSLFIFGGRSAGEGPP